MRILLLETNERLLKQIQAELTKRNFIVDIATQSETAWDLLHSFVYSLIVLDLSPPKSDGIQLCRRLRAVGNSILVLLLVSPAHYDDRLKGLEAGADAYLLKPIHFPELFAQIHALSRRGVSRGISVLSWGPLQLDPLSRQVTCHGQPLKISRKEYLLLELFLRHPRQRFTREEIGDRLWTLDESLPTDATIKSHIRSIRRKLEKVGVGNFIQTRYGHGYGLNPAFNPHQVTPQFLIPQTQPSIDKFTAHIWSELMGANSRLQQEIEEHQQTAAKLKRSEQFLRNAQQVARIGSWEFDVQTRQTYWTEELYHIHGLDPRQPPPNPEQQRDYIHPDDLLLYDNSIRTPALQGKPFEVNLRIVRSDGEIRYINARGGAIFNEAGELSKLTGTTFDLTDYYLF
ncbi:response regulator transcription factor [Cyanothece sp. BG0011]|uniref:response regulator transcription factor n=1 Tax=Cyanothece sp. BG0011 TaxID=2082950 RepID=UPI000D1FD9C4|nr:response regulator transcription factor [Cyanothece sp. BG0011]